MGSALQGVLQGRARTVTATSSRAWEDWETGYLISAYPTQGLEEIGLTWHFVAIDQGDVLKRS